MKKSFHIQTPFRIITVKIGARREREDDPHERLEMAVAPSIVAASLNSFGSAWKKPTSTSTPSGIPNVE